MAEVLTVWRFVDGKPGHENQSAGLVRALAEQTALSVEDIPVKRGWRNWLDFLLARCPADQGGMSPGLLIGAGHATHLPMLACKRACGGRVVALMKPSLPVNWFDLCVIPEHDGVAASKRVLVTRGVLNIVEPKDKPGDAPGLILLGGPSSEYAWDDVQMHDQVHEIVSDKARSWLVVGSRRTPGSMIDSLRGEVDGERVQVLAQEQTQPGWLASQLGKTSLAWVSEDSVSMVYEVLTAGAACGLLSVPVKKRGRVQKGGQGLLEQGLVTPFNAWARGAALAAPAKPFDEAARAAQWVLKHV